MKLFGAFYSNTVDRVKTWDPWTTYDLTREERAAREERVRMRLVNKKKFQKMVTDPYQFGKGHHFDPAIQRWVAMKASEYDYFKPTPKTAIYGVGIVLLPIVFFIGLMLKTDAADERRYRSGQVTYKDRDFKFHS